MGSYVRVSLKAGAGGWPDRSLAAARLEPVAFKRFVASTDPVTMPATGNLFDGHARTRTHGRQMVSFS